MIEGVDKEKKTNSSTLSYDQIMKIKYGDLSDQVDVVKQCLPQEKANTFIVKFLYPKYSISTTPSPSLLSPEIKNDDLYFLPDNLKKNYW